MSDHYLIMLLSPIDLVSRRPPLTTDDGSGGAKNVVIHGGYFGAVALAWSIATSGTIASSPSELGTRPGQAPGLLNITPSAIKKEKKKKRTSNVCKIGDLLGTYG